MLCWMSRRPPSAALGSVIRRRMFSLVPRAASATLRLTSSKRSAASWAIWRWLSTTACPPRRVVSLAASPARRIASAPASVPRRATSAPASAFWRSASPVARLPCSAASAVRRTAASAAVSATVRALSCTTFPTTAGLMGCLVSCGLLISAMSISCQYIYDTGKIAAPHNDICAGMCCGASATVEK